MVNKNKATGTEIDEYKFKSPDLSCLQKGKNKLKERNVQHVKITNMRDLNDYYAYGEKLGKGVFGTVIEVTDKSTKNVWALKIVDKKLKIKGSRVNNIENELRILRMVTHPHIIYLERTFESQSHLYLVIERCTTDLASILREKKTFTEEETRLVLAHLASATSYLHKHDIIHRDMKMENILTAPNPENPSDSLYIKVSDFGLAIVKSGFKLDEMLTERCGTLIYMAPEIISRSAYSQQCDIWAIGVICYLLLTGHFPFFNQIETQLCLLICNSNPFQNMKLKLSVNCMNLLRKLLEKNAALRISAAEIQRHPWVQGKEEQAEQQNVLDMMTLWHDEMMVPNTDLKTSDWAEAFSNLEAKPDYETMRKEDSDDVIQKNVITSNVASKSKQSKSKNDKTVPTAAAAAATPATATPAAATPAAATPAAATPVAIPTRAFNIAGQNTKLIQIGKKPNHFNK